VLDSEPCRGVVVLKAVQNAGQGSTAVSTSSGLSSTKTAITATREPPALAVCAGMQPLERILRNGDELAERIAVGLRTGQWERSWRCLSVYDNAAPKFPLLPTQTRSVHDTGSSLLTGWNATRPQARPTANALRPGDVWVWCPGRSARPTRNARDGPGTIETTVSEPRGALPNRCGLRGLIDGCQSAA
jgi:hypothetical protein